MFTTAQFARAKHWKKPIPSTVEWINQLWHIHTMEYYIA